MSVRITKSLFRFAVLAVLTLALVATGAAHRMPKVSDLAAADRALAFVAATGATAADICGDTGSASRHTDSLCQACQIAGSFFLPDQSDGLQKLDLARLTDTVAPKGRWWVPRSLQSANLAQGPPVA
jgi:hypothetical protein